MNRTKAQRRPLPRLVAPTLSFSAAIVASMAMIAILAILAIIANTACGRPERATLGHDAYIFGSASGHSRSIAR